MVIPRFVVIKAGPTNMSTLSLYPIAVNSGVVSALPAFHSLDFPFVPRGSRNLLSVRTHQHDAISLELRVVDSTSRITDPHLLFPAHSSS
jgi:hypothetical protein